LSHLRAVRRGIDMSKIVFTCECGKSVSVDRKFAGRHGRCPRCNAVVQIPGEAATTPDATPPGLAPASADTRPPLPPQAGGVEEAFPLPQKMRANRFIAGKMCAICQTKIAVGDEVRNCERCHTSFHLACWQEVGGCGTYGCENSPGVASPAGLSMPYDEPSVLLGCDPIRDLGAASNSYAARHAPSSNAPAAAPVAMPVTAGIGCPRCGSRNIKQKRHTSGVGWGLFFGGVVAALFTCGIGLILCVIAVFLYERRGHCSDCGWMWKT